MRFSRYAVSGAFNRADSNRAGSNRVVRLFACEPFRKLPFYGLALHRRDSVPRRLQSEGRRAGEV